MIPRHMRIVFWCLIAAVIAMGAWLYHVHRQEVARMQALGNDTPIDAPATDTEPITLDLADDSTGTITAVTKQIALPSEATARARALVDHLVSEYAQPDSKHPLPPGTAVDGVFLLPLPINGRELDRNSKPNDTGDRTSTTLVPADPNSPRPESPGGELAVINLRSQFVNGHPSGVEVETLTILSIIGTLHANLPQIEQIKFLVDGQPRETLAGHADLFKMYPSRDTTTKQTSNP